MIRRRPCRQDLRKIGVHCNVGIFQTFFHHLFRLLFSVHLQCPWHRFVRWAQFPINAHVSRRHTAVVSMLIIIVHERTRHDTFQMRRLLCCCQDLADSVAVTPFLLCSPLDQIINILMLLWIVNAVEFAFTLADSSWIRNDIGISTFHEIFNIAGFQAVIKQQRFWWDRTSFNSLHFFTVSRPAHQCRNRTCIFRKINIYTETDTVAQCHPDILMEFYLIAWP